MVVEVAEMFKQQAGPLEVCRVCCRVIGVPKDGILACSACRSGELLSVGAAIEAYDAYDGTERSTRRVVRLAIGHCFVGPRRVYIKARLRFRRLLWLRVDFKLEQ